MYKTMFRVPVIATGNVRKAHASSRWMAITNNGKTAKFETESQAWERAEEHKRLIAEYNDGDDLGYEYKVVEI